MEPRGVCTPDEPGRRAAEEEILLVLSRSMFLKSVLRPRWRSSWESSASVSTSDSAGDAAFPGEGDRAASCAGDGRCMRWRAPRTPRRKDTRRFPADTRDCENIGWLVDLCRGDIDRFLAVMAALGAVEDFPVAAAEEEEG